MDEEGASDVSLLRRLLNQREVRREVQAVLCEPGPNCNPEEIETFLEALASPWRESLSAMSFLCLDEIQAASNGAVKLSAEPKIAAVAGLLNLTIISACSLYPYGWIESHAAVVQWIQKSSDKSARACYLNDIIEWVMGAGGAKSQLGAIQYQIMLQSAVHIAPRSEKCPILLEIAQKSLRDGYLDKSDFDLLHSLRII